MIILLKVFKGLQIGLRAQFVWKCINLIKHYNQQLITLTISVNEGTVCSLAFASLLPKRALVL